MPAFSDKSQTKLSSCHDKLQCVFNEVIKHFDCKVVTGYRGEEAQNRMFEMDRSQLTYPDSKHNQQPSLAVDVAPYPIDWNDIGRFRYFAGYVMGIASQLGVSLRWGGDWDKDTEVKDNNFNDLLHFELSDGTAGT